MNKDRFFEAGHAAAAPPNVSYPRGHPMSAAVAPPISSLTDDTIALLVDRFYAAIRRHAVLAPIFEAAIAPDEWQAHLATMRRFWSSVMLASGAYSGNPVAVHRAVTGLERPMFAQWLALFEATATALFTPELAGAFVAKAHRIATSLELAVFHRLGAPPDGLRLPARPAPRAQRAASPCD
jgi:hemoglobin